MSARKKGLLFIVLIGLICCAGVYLYRVVEPSAVASGPLPLEEIVTPHKTFRANYTQVFHSKLTKKETATKGTMYFSAPMTARFDYEEEPRIEWQNFHKDGETTIIGHEKKRVFRVAGDARDYILFLNGIDALKQEFVVTESKVEVARKVGMHIPEGGRLFKLKPKNKTKDSSYNLKYLFLIVDDTALRSFAAVDEIGNINQYLFSDVEYDVPLPPETFVPTIPEGYEVYEEIKKK